MIHMACGCSDKKLNLEDIKNMSIDKIVELYRNGYRLEGPDLETQEINCQKDLQQTKYLSPGAHPTIVDTTGSVFDSNTVIVAALAENKASLGYTTGMARFIGSKYDPIAHTCTQDFANRWESCFNTTAWNLKYIVRAWIIGQGTFNYGCIDSYPCTGGDTCPGTATCGTWGSRIDHKDSIAIHANNQTPPPAPTGLNVTPGNTTLTITWNAVADPTGGDVFAYYVGVFPSGSGTPIVSGYTESTLRNVTIGGLTNGTNYTVQVNGKSHNFIDGASATSPIVTPVGPTQPKIFSACWNKPTVTTPCGLSPSLPPIPVNSSFQIAADIYNIGPTGKVRCVFKDGTTTIGTVDNASLQQCTGNQCTQTAYQWYPTVTYTMPNRDVTLNISTYGWDGTNWTSSPVDSQTLTISSSPICTGITLTPFSGSVTAGDHVNFSSTVTPSYPTLQEFQVVFTLCNDINCTSGTTLTTVTTVNKVATYSWDTTGKSAGTYYIRASVVNQCYSTVSAINVSVPIPTYTVDIYARDINTNSPISGATVTIGTLAPKTTDTTGHVQFTVEQGTINITITANNYNTFTTSESVYSNISKPYLLSPVSAGPGDLNFIVVAPGAADQAADVYFDSTKQGTTSATTGVLLVSGLPNGQVINYTVKKSGYNDTSGTVTVVGGTTTDVAVSLTVSTPNTGNVCIRSNPAGATITIDGTLQTGKVTAFSGGGCVSQNTVTGLDPTVTHSYELNLTGYQKKTGSFAVTAETTIILEVGDLTKAVAEAGFGAAGMILIGGLAIGAIYAATRKKPQIPGKTIKK